MSSTLGIIIGNRDFFPDHLITEARNEVLNIFKNKGLKPIILKDSDTKLGGVETFLEAQKCADLFKSHKDEIEGILVVLPNFGDEKGVADTIRLSGLDVPVLVQATPDDLDKMQERHSQTLQNVKELQGMEEQLYSQLENGNKNLSDDLTLISIGK